MESKEKQTRISIIKIYQENPTYTFEKIAKLANTHRKTGSNVIKKFATTLTVDRKQSSGGKTGPKDKKIERKVIEVITKKPSISKRDTAKKSKTSPSMVQRVKARNDLQTYKKHKKPKRTDLQFNTGINRAKKLDEWLENRKNSCVIEDDETYVKMDFSTLPGPQYYTKKRGTTLPESEETIYIEKFGAKRMIWQAICQCGLRSAPFITNQTMNAKIYITECLQKRLLPLIRKHKVSTIFWPDLASIHYAADTVKFMKDNHIDFVPKEMNPAAVPEDRKIETYWALVKSELKKEPKAAKNDEEFKYRWKRASSRVTEDTIKLLMAGVREKIRLRSKMKKK